MIPKAYWGFEDLGGFLNGIRLFLFCLISVFLLPLLLLRSIWVPAWLLSLVSDSDESEGESNVHICIVGLSSL